MTRAHPPKPSRYGSTTRARSTRRHGMPSERTRTTHQTRKAMNMGNDITADRSAILKAATLVRPALASLSFVPALTHIMFDGEWATAYDDRMAIAVCCSAGIHRLIPGVLLVQALTAFGGKEVLFHQDADDSFVMKSGRSKVKLPTLPLASFPFDWPDSTDTPWIDL